MGIDTGILDDWHASLAALTWLQELGACEPVGDLPVDRFALPEREALPPAQSREARHVPPPQAAAGSHRSPAGSSADPPAGKTADTTADAPEIARQMAGAARSLEALAAALADYTHCDLRRGARSTVFADGNPKARVMVIGEAPGRDEDLAGRPFVGRAGQLLDRMFATIGLARTSPDSENALYITNVMPWRPPSNREPTAQEMAMMVPFLERHVALADPQVIVLMGNTPALAVLKSRGITRLRGRWTEGFGKPVLPMLHPAYLLRNPHAKRDSWADLLELRRSLRG